MSLLIISIFGELNVFHKQVGHPKNIGLAGIPGMLESRICGIILDLNTIPK
jgi:hypothetical protein